MLQKLFKTSLNIKNLEKQDIVDLLVIGGGINGAGVARDAAGRGLSVVICEKNDWSSATSSASTKLIHGGLRYLEQYEFGLVKSALVEREVLYHSAPHMIYPMHFVLPHNKNQRPKWMIRAGLFLYDHLGFMNRSDVFQKSHSISLKTHPLQDEYKNGFVYTDGWVDDARFTLANVVAAHENGAIALSRTECIAIEADKENNVWVATLANKSLKTGKTKKYKIRTRTIVNAAGPWINKVISENFQSFKPKHKIRLVKGSHIVVPQMYQGDHAYILQNDDKRIIFTIPYEKKFTLIGTTDIAVSGDPEKAEISEKEKTYLCNSVNKYFKSKTSKKDIVWTYSGVRPLLDDGESNASEVTRDYKIDLSYHDDLPVLSIYGGKITTFRTLSEKVVNKLADNVFKEKSLPEWTVDEVLPGGELSGAANVETFMNTLNREFSWLPEGMLERLSEGYGSRIRTLLKDCHRVSDMGKDFGDNVYEAEISYLINYEDAGSIDDILWRRSKLGLHISEQTEKNIVNYIKKAVKSEEIHSSD